MKKTILLAALLLVSMTSSTVLANVQQGNLISDVGGIEEEKSPMNDIRKSFIKGIEAYSNTPSSNYMQLACEAEGTCGSDSEGGNVWGGTKKSKKSTGMMGLGTDFNARRDAHREKKKKEEKAILISMINLHKLDKSRWFNLRKFDLRKIDFWAKRIEWLDVSSPKTPIRNSECGGDPVYLHSGEFTYTCVDWVIPGRGMNIELKRSYRSGRNFNGPFGYGWNFNYYYRLFASNNGNVTIINNEGQKTEYTYDEVTKKFVAPAGYYETLEKNKDGTGTLTKANGDSLTFDVDGNLAAITDRNGNAITLSYDSKGLLPIIGPSEPGQTPGERVIIGYDYRLKKIADPAGRVTITLEYNDDGRVETITDNHGRAINFAYDPVTDDLLTQTFYPSPKNPSGFTKTFTYTDHDITTITDAKNQTFVTNRYDDQGRVTEQDLGSGTLVFDYSVAGQTTLTDRKGYKTTHTFNAAGVPTQVEQLTHGVRKGEAASFRMTYSYNANSEITSVTYPKGNGIKYTYDESNADLRAQGNLLEVRRKTNMAQSDNDTNDIVTVFTYEPNFNFIKRTTDPKGNVTAYTYDYELKRKDRRHGNKGNLVTIEYPQVNGEIPEFNFYYDKFGQITKVIDPNNISTTYDYFPKTGYLKKIRRDPKGINAVIQLTYDKYGNLDVVTDANGHKTDLDFDGSNRLITKTDVSGYKTKYTHDKNGNVEKIERQADEAATQWQTTEFTYTVHNDLTTAEDSLSRQTTYTYDAGQNFQKIIDAEGHSTTYEYDERGLLYKVTDSNTPQGITRYDYDANGNLSRITDANTNKTNYVYDDFDRPSTATFADGKYSEFLYDKNGNLTQRKTLAAASGTFNIEYDYDNLNRLTKKRFPSNALLDTSYDYDGGSRLTDADNAASKIHFNYDALNRIDDVTQTLNSTLYLLDYDYDNAGNRTQMIYPSGKNVEYLYDDRNRLKDIKLEAKVMTHYAYDPLNRIKTKDYVNIPGPQQTSYQFDIANQAQQITNTLVPATNISQYSYPSYDRVGNRKQLDRTFQANPVETTEYGYNDIYELTSVTGAQTNSYAYDKVGNRTTADAVAYSPNKMNQYKSVNAVKFSYDDNGNLSSDGTNTYAYDEENRLFTLTDGTTNASYGYDAFNRRVSKTVDGATTDFVYDGSEVIAEYGSAGTLEAEYVMGGFIDEVLTMTRAGNEYYYHYDGLGSVTEITDNTGAVVENYEYDAYGHPSVTSSAIGNPYKFTGRRWDEESGIYFYRARMYDPAIGRFLQRDPMGYYDSMNSYTYVFNSPNNWIDPFGLFTFSDAVIARYPKTVQHINNMKPSSRAYAAFLKVVLAGKAKVDEAFTPGCGPRIVLSNLGDAYGQIQPEHDYYTNIIEINTRLFNNFENSRPPKDYFFRKRFRDINLLVLEATVQHELGHIFDDRNPNFYGDRNKKAKYAHEEGEAVEYYTYGRTIWLK